MLTRTKTVKPLATLTQTHGLLVTVILRWYTGWIECTVDNDSLLVMNNIIWIKCMLQILQGI